MRAFVLGVVLFGALAWARPAHAQFQNHSIGFELGYLYLQPTFGLDAAALPPAFGIDATLYIENGFDVGLRFSGAIQKDHVDANQPQLVVLYPAFMGRYFLSEDYFRPYIGANLEFVHVFGAPENSALGASGSSYATSHFGIAPTAGFEYFVSDEWSVGLNAEFAYYFALNADSAYSIQVWGRVATHF